MDINQLNRFSQSVILGFALSAASLITPAATGQDGADQDPPVKSTEQESDDPAEVDTREKDPKTRLIEELLEELEGVRAELAAVRHELATLTLERDEAVRERDELRQFMRDNREFGDDFAQYQEIKEITRQAERRRAAEEARKRHEEERARRLAARQQAGQIDTVQQAEREKIERYQRAGFEPLGLDVYLGRTGFFYGVTEGEPALRIEYEPIIGHFLEPAAPISRIDYTKMTISGTVLNASDETRNVGIAIAFFDRAGNQVGSETVQISNARPNVPYPFTSSIEMGLDGPFASSTSWVLYADPVE